MVTVLLPIGTRNEESKKIEALSSLPIRLPVPAFLILEAQALGWQAPVRSQSIQWSMSTL